MKFELWKLLSLITWFSVAMGALFGTQLPWGIRIGVFLILVGLLLTIGRLLIPHRAPREHVENDAVFLQVWADAIFLGTPAFFIWWIGFSLLLSHPILGFFGAFVCSLAYIIIIFNKGQNEPKTETQ